jgi:hypothetical protein
MFIRAKEGTSEKAASPSKLWREALGNSLLNNKYSLLYLKVKGLKSRLLTDLIRVLGASPSGIGYTIESAELTLKDNKYQLIDLLCVDFILLFVCLRQNFCHRNQDISNILEFFPLYSISWK